jgi:hypothetical protein
MKVPKIRPSLIYAVLLVFATTVAMQANENQRTLQNKTYEYGFSVGYLFPGKIEISEAVNEFNKAGSFLLKGFIDSYLIPKLAAGLYLQYSYSTLEEKDIFSEEITNHNVSIFEIGGSIKPRFILSPSWALKPGLNIGYRKFFFDFTADCGIEADNADGFGVNAGLEIQHLYSNQLIIFMEIGMVSQPYGGKQDITYIDFPPIFYINAGIAL